MDTMATEIELKYLVVNDHLVDKVTSTLTTQNLHFSFDQLQLSNCYFDTQDLAMRKLDFGLRVRSRDEHREQTIKTAGQVVGGLHKRPEYNVDIKDNFPNLSLFPAEIWPKGTNTKTLQNNLVVLFTTHFTRYRWLIQYQQSAVELVFDSGTITASGGTVAICEVELELVSGDVSALFDLAELLMSQLSMRPGIQSKAARGYQLWQPKSKAYQFEQFPLIPLSGHNTTLGAFYDGLSFALTELQTAIDAYFELPSLNLLQKISQSLILLRHGLWLFERFLTPEQVKLRKELSHFIRLFSWVTNAKNVAELLKNKSNYRKKIEYSEQLVSQLQLAKRRIPEAEHVFALLQDTRFNHLQLGLLKCLVNRETEPSNDVKTDNMSLFTFAKNTLAQSLDELNTVMPQGETLTVEQFLAQKSLLNRNLQTGSWLGYLFDEKIRAEYRAPWLDIMAGITELETLYFLRQQLTDLDEQPPKLIMWLDNKIDNLLVALNASRQIALTVAPYWSV